MDQKNLRSFLVNKSVLLMRVELYHVKEEPLYFIMVLDRTLQLARYLDLINFEKTNHVLGSYLCTCTEVY